MEYIGILELKDTVDITDPCYDKDVCYRMTIKCTPGTYKGYIESFNDYVTSISIFKDNKIISTDQMELIGSIGVDAGLAGFFDNKPDFSDEEWQVFCDKIETGVAWNIYNGIFSYSGYGDGSYPVYANKERSAFTIVFID